jgi:hypothetical protein
LPERGRGDVQRQVEVLTRAVQIGFDLRDERCEPCCVFDQIGVGELAAQIVGEYRGIVAETDFADAFVGCRDQHEAEGGRALA